MFRFDPVNFATKYRKSDQKDNQFFYVVKDGRKLGAVDVDRLVSFFIDEWFGFVRLDTEYGRKLLQAYKKETGSQGSDGMLLWECEDFMLDFDPTAHGDKIFFSCILKSISVLELAMDFEDYINRQKDK